MKRKQILLAAGCAVLLAAGIGAKMFFDHYLLAAGQVIPRSAGKVDLREEALSAEDYEQIQAELPECEILWNVPFQDGSLPSDSREIQISALTEEDVLTLDYFPYLTRLDAVQCTDYPQLLAFQERQPECSVVYQVTLGGTAYPNDAAALQIVDPSVEELEALLPYLTEVTQVRLSGQLPELDRLTHLQEAFPEIAFCWEVPVGDTVVDSTAAALDLSGLPLDYDAAAGLLKWFPELETVDMRECALTDEEMMTLAERYPQCFFLWEMTIGELRISTDAEEVDISGVQLQSAEEIEALLPFFPNVKRVVMCKCGLDDETMDALNGRYEDIRFIWSVRIRNVYVRTDATYFYPFKFDRDMRVDNDDLYPLRYCTDMVCIDIGHMGEVTDCEWAAFMPELKYLVIGETRISDLTPLSNCKKLAFLEIFTIPVTDYSPLVECTGLEDLNLGKTYADPAPIAKMTWLKNVWWSGVHGTHGLPASNAKEVLTEALPNTHLRFDLAHPTADGWRKLENYFGMRDFMGMFYLT